MCRIRPRANRGERRRCWISRHPALPLRMPCCCWAAKAAGPAPLLLLDSWELSFSGVVFVPLSYMAKEEINAVYINQHLLLINSSPRPFLLQIRILYPRQKKKSSVPQQSFNNTAQTIPFFLKSSCAKDSCCILSTSPHKHYLAHTGAWAQPAQLHTK